MAELITKMGYEGLLYYGTAGSTASTLLTNCVDLDYQQEPQKGETTVKGTGTSPPIETERVTSIKVTITWKMLNKPADTSLAALRAAGSTGAPVALRTKDYSSGTGFDGDCTVSVKNGAPLKGEQTFEFTATPTGESLRTPLLNS